MSETQLCPCGSELALNACCAPVIAGKKKAETAEALLRARYTAFTQGAVDFILETHHPRTREHTNREEIEQWSKGSEWLGLKILQSEGGQPKDTMGTIIFHGCSSTRSP
jgi:SEC-C motif domain protein